MKDLKLTTIHYSIIGFVGFLGLLIAVAAVADDDSGEAPARIEMSFDQIEQELDSRNELDSRGTNIQIPNSTVLSKNHRLETRKKEKSKNLLIDSLKKEIMRLAKSNQILKEENIQLKKSSSGQRKKSFVGASSSLKAQKNKTLDITKYLDKTKATRQLRSTTGKNKWVWVKLRFLEGLKLYQGSQVSLLTEKTITLNGKTIPAGSTVDGICSLSKSRLFIEFSQINEELSVTGEAYQLIDRSIGVRVNVKSISARDDLLKNLTDNASDIISLIDPTKAIPKTINSQKDFPSELFVNISDDTMILAKLSPGE